MAFSQRSRFRRTVAALAALTFLAFVGCSSGDDDAEEATTTTSTEESDDDVPVTVSDSEFDEAVGAVEDEVAAEGADLCQVVRSLFDVPSLAPSSTAQVERAVEATVVFLDQLADLDEVDDASTEALRDAAAKLREQAEAADYSVEFFSSGASDQIFRDPAVAGVLQDVVQQAADECGPEVFDGLPVETFEEVE